MKFKIVNKNNNQEYYCDENVIVTKNFNENLDSCSFRISHLSSKIDIEPYDNIVIMDENGRFSNLYMCVDTYSCIEEGLDEVTYSYEISCFSETKLLEGIILPNLSITQRRDNYPKRSIWYYIDKYMNMYSPQIRVRNVYEPSKYYYSSKWSWNNLQVDKFNVDCPEFQWNNPTLREVLNDLFMVVDCIPVLENGVLKYLDLTSRGKEIVNYNYIQESQSSSDYVSELYMDLQNVMQSSVEGVNDVVTTTELIPFVSDDWQVTSENVVLKTQFPILNIKHLWVIIMAPHYTPPGGEADSFIYLKRDLMNLNLNNEHDEGGSLVKEYDEYSVLPVEYRTFDIKANLYDFNHRSALTYNSISGHFSRYQNYCLYFNRYGKKIMGFSNIQKGYIFSSGNPTLDWIKAVVNASYQNEQGWTVEEQGSVYPARDLIKGDNAYYSIFFQIEYETTANQVYIAGKSINPTNDKIVVDNQTNSYVDAFNQGNLEVQKANRLGNKNYMINSRFNDNYNNLPSIGDYKGNQVAYQVQYQIYNNHIEANAQCCENYVLRNYFTGVQSKVRTWVNAKEESLIRHDINKVYCEVSDRERKDTFDIQSEVYGDIVNVCMNGFYYENANPIKYVIMFNGLYESSNPIYYSLNCIGRVIGNSLVFTAGFEDNYYVSKYVYNDYIDVNIEIEVDNDYQYPYHITKDSVKSYGGIPLNVYSYVRTDGSDVFASGEFREVIFSFLEDLKLQRYMQDEEGKLIYKDLVFKDEDLMDLEDSSDVFLRSLSLPKIEYYEFNNNNKVFKSMRTVWKDNREIFMMSTQIEFCGDGEDYYVTRYFVQRLKAISKVAYDNLNDIKIYITDEENSFVYGALKPNTDNFYNPTTMSVAGSNMNGNIEFDFNNTNVFPVGSSVWVCDKDGRVLIGFKSHSVIENWIKLYFNVLRSRNKNIYDIDGNIVGNI